MCEADAVLSNTVAMLKKSVDVDSGPNQATHSTVEQEKDHDSIEWKEDVGVLSMECE